MIIATSKWLVLTINIESFSFAFNYSFALNEMWQTVRIFSKNVYENTPLVGIEQKKYQKQRRVLYFNSSLLTEKHAKHTVK